MELRSSRIVALTVLFILALSTPAFSWPFGEKKKAEVKASPASNIASKSPTAPQAASTRTVKAVPAASGKSSQSDEDFFAEEEEDAPILPELPQIPQTKIPGLTEIPRSAYVPQVPGLPQTVSSSLVSGNAQPAIQDPEIVRIQAQIKEIVKINESLKANFSGQAAEIQKINDQAVIHQKILKDLDDSKKMAAQGNAENYLNREKVRLIEEQTEKNQKFIQDLKSKTTPSVSGASNLSNPLESNAEKKV